MATQELLSNLNLFHDARARVLICTQDDCKFALSNGPSRVTTHLRDKHNIPTEARKGLSRLLKSLSPPGLLDPDEAPLRADGSPEHDKLRVYEGFACIHCPFRTISRQLIRRHLSSPPDDCRFKADHARPRPRRDLDQQFECVYLQTWTTGSTRKYWIIKRGGSIVRPVDGPAVQAHLRAVLTRELDRRQRPAAAEPAGEMTAFALQRPWMERTGWDQTYRGRGRRQVLAAMTRTFTSPGGREHLLGRRGVCGLDEDLVSPGGDEDRIASLVRLADVMMDRCEETVRKTSRHVLCWLRSTQTSSIYSKPFTLVQQASSSGKYRLLLKRCLAMVFRLYRMPPDTRMQAAGLALNKKQLQFLDAIWAYEAVGDSAALEKLAGKYRGSARRGQTAAGHGEYRQDQDEDDEGNLEEDEEDEEDDEEEKDDDDDEDNDDKEDEDGEFTTWMNDLGEISDDEIIDEEAGAGAARGSPEELVELLFGLTLALATQPVIDGQPQTTVLIYFSGILGFSSSPDSAFLPARSYTSTLSGLIYILRLLFLEYALPLRAYHTLALERRPRIGQLNRLQPIRRQYMVMESQSPLEELLSLRNFGYVMSRTDTPPCLLRWSDNGQVVSLGDEISISMGQFRRLPEHFIKEAARLCTEMMFSWDPAIDLSSIRDDMTNNEEGFSFVLHPGNKLDTAYLELCCRASRAHRHGLFRGGDWEWNAVFQYFKKDEALRAAILGGMFCAGGQLPRCTELLSLLCSNGELHPRGIYVYDRSMIYITRHHKAKRATNREFVVARFLPAQLGHILYKYLVYIRPFIDMLHRERGLGLSGEAAVESPLLFREDIVTPSRHWQTGRLTAILKGATSTVWGIPVNSRQFRQISIGITEKHVREVFQPFNRFDDKSASASRNVVFAWQSGHRPLQRGTTYGLDGAFPTKLQPQLLELYRWAASRWHEFLHLPSHAAHMPVTEDPLKRDVRSSPLTGCRDGDEDEDGDGDTGVATSVAASPPRVALGWSCSPQAAERHPPARQALVWSSCGPAPGRATQQHQIRRTDRDPSSSDGSWDGEAAGEKEDAIAFFNRIYREDQEAFERESLRQRQQQAAWDEPARHDRSAKRSIHQTSGSQDAAPRPKRSRTLPLPLSLERGRDRGPGRLGQASQVGRDPPHDDRRYRSLFGHPSDLPTTGAIDSLQAMLDHLRGRISFSNDNNALRARIKLWKLGERLEGWSTVGCQLCFINDEPGLDHTIDDCTMIGSDTARRLLGWLETLRLDRFGRTYGLCSLCTEDSQVCQEVVVANQICCASTEDEKNHWRQRRDSAAGPDGLCENKLVIRRTIAALCTSDDQILGKALTKFISEKDGVDLTAESQAIEWFERKVPHREAWVPQLLVVLDILVAAFDLLRGRRRRDRRADSGHDGSSEGGVGLHCDVPSLEMSWDDSDEVAGWKVVMDWWVGKCSFCAGRGVRGPQIEHALRQCPFGGKPTLKMGLAEAIFEEGIWALGGCLGCALPRELCQAWSKSASGRWKRDQGIRCQYGRQAYDTAIGFFYCKERKYRQELIESMADAGLENFDEEEVASWLGRKITVAGIESSEIMRQLRWWSGILWDKMKE
ncbi:hypothetical protein FALCPG4_018851 [Fusarium falciforme]